MRRNPMGHGGLAIAGGAFLAASAVTASPVRVQSRVFEIDYEVNAEALPLDSVHLWYTLDEGRQWHKYGIDEDRQSPLTFHAPTEGLYGFFLRVTNNTGSSSGEPTSSTKPHRYAFIDFTPPVVQLHALRQTTALGQRVLQIRWTAIDAHLTSRPVEIEYQPPAGGQWRTVTTDPLANTGRYDWRVPDNLLGPVAVRVQVSDKGGHRVASERQVAEITLSAASESSLAALGTGSGTPGEQPGYPTNHDPSENMKKRARRLYEEGLAFRDMGNHRRAVARLREVVRLNPQMPEAFAEMGAMLYLLGDLERALAAYEIALAQRPTMRPALQGAAKVYRRNHDYASAAERLRTILRYNPNDAETWMNLGDIGIFQGDELLARECYLRATQIDPSATEVIALARKRLALMAEVSRTYVEKGR